MWRLAMGNDLRPGPHIRGLPAEVHLGRRRPNHEEPAMDPILIVSADGHWGGPPSQYRDYIEREFVEDLDALTEKDQVWRDGSLTQRRFSTETLELIDPDRTVRSGGERGAWEGGRRLAEKDR